MERCTLCGGKVVGGRCRECGLDNTKNDKKYRLNAHNAKDTVFHHDDCDDQVNRKKKQPTARNVQTQTTYQKQAQKQQSKQQTGSAQRTAGTLKAPSRDLSKEERLEDLRRQHQEIKKQRSEAGTVKKKGSCFGKLLKWIIILGVLYLMFPVIGEELIPAARRTIYEITGQDFFKVFDSEKTTDRPEIAEWDVSAEGYYEDNLMPGYYWVGYDIPEGSYQLFCDEGTAWLYLWADENADTQYVNLYSKDLQDSYAESFGESEYYELSDVIELKQGGCMYIDKADHPLRIVGEGKGIDSLETFGPQDLPQKTELKGTMKVGEDLPAGVYNVQLDLSDTQRYNSGYVTVTDEEGEEAYYFTLTEDVPEFLRLPLYDKWEITLNGYNDKPIQAFLVPGY